MGLIDIKTNLKSLKYGNDTLGGGSSGQPYIQTSIPNSFNDLGAREDFLLRGGNNNTRDTVADIKRLTKMFADTKSPNGILFIAKQQLLSRTAVRTQTSGILNGGSYLPSNTLAQAGVVGLGGHLNKQGNPFDETGAYSNNDNLYGVKVKYSQPTVENRLAQLYDTYIRVKNNSPNVLSYPGGPGSNLGAGNTNIRFASAEQRTGINNYQSTTPSYIPFFTGSYKPIFEPGDYLKTIFSNDNRGVSGKYQRLTNVSIISSYNPQGILIESNNVYEPTIEGNTWPKNTSLIYENNTFTYTQEDIINTNINPPSAPKSSPKTQDFRKVLREKLEVTTEQGKAATDSGATSLSLSYNVSQNQTIEGRVGLGDPGARSNKSYADYSKGIEYSSIDVPELGFFKPGLDKINSIPIYRSENVVQDNIVNDLVKFRIAIIDNNAPNFKTFIHFRAFLDSMNDSYSSNWNSFQYLGRGEQFYTYNGFTRQISLSWTVAAQSKQELIPMYKKLNYLASSLTPDYSPNGYMRGVLCQLTVGGYLYEQPGFITSLTYDVPSESPWEIAINADENGGGDSSVKELPHIIKVSGFSFTPIHNFIPRLQKNTYRNTNGTPNTNNDIGFVNAYGPERYIALSNGSGSNYNNYDN
jgi:hypothetical protein